MAKEKKTGFDACYRMYAQKMYGLAFKMVHNRQDALDIVQESFIRAYENWHKFRGDSAVSTWLFKITLNQSYDYLRKRQREKTVEMDRDFEDRRKYFGEAKIIR